MHTKALPYIGLLSLFWGTNIVVSRYGIGEFEPFLFIALRLASATAVVIFVFLIQVLILRSRTIPTDLNFWKYTTISGVIGVAIPMSLFILSLQYQSSGVASIFITSGPIFVVLAAHFFLPDERMTRNKGLGVLLALAGALFLAARGESGLADVQQANSLGFIMVVLALASDAANAILVRRRMTEMDPVAVTCVRLAVGGLITSIAALWIGQFSFADVGTTYSTMGIFAVIYAGLIGALAGQFLAFVITRRFGATAFSLTSYLIPVVATFFGVFLLDEIVTWGMGVGVLLIGSGIYMINRMPSNNLSQSQRGFLRRRKRTVPNET